MGERMRYFAWHKEGVWGMEKRLFAYCLTVSSTSGFPRFGVT